MMMLNTISKILLAALMLLGSGMAMAEDAVLKPFMLGSKGAGTVAEKAEEVNAALTSKGFNVVGTYSPYPDAIILIVSNDELKSNAANSEHGGFGAVVRVAVTKVKDDVQVSYTNPVYMSHVYRMKGDLKSVATKLEETLGKVEEFGAKGMSATQARKYHYMIGMEYFTEPSLLAEYGSHEEALKMVEAGLAANKAGVTKVYRVDVPGKEESVFGVAMKGATEADKFMDDKYIMSEIDFRDIKSTAHLPYEVLVSGKKVLALYARFRIAINFPDLSMMGNHSFMNIMNSPEAIRKALQKTVSK
jgi:hypothetical protein